MHADIRTVSQTGKASHTYTHADRQPSIPSSRQPVSQTYRQACMYTGNHSGGCGHHNTYTYPDRPVPTARLAYTRI